MYLRARFEESECRSKRLDLGGLKYCHMLANDVHVLSLPSVRLVWRGEECEMDDYQSDWKERLVWIVCISLVS